MLMLVLMTLTCMQGHSGTAKAKNQRCMLSAAKPAISMKLATKVGHFYLTLTLQAFIWLSLPTCSGGFGQCIEHTHVFFGQEVVWRSKSTSLHHHHHSGIELEIKLICLEQQVLV